MTLAYEYQEGHRIPEHIHNEDQLVFARRGVMTVSSRDHIWLIPPLRAVWIPRGVAHSIRMSGQVSMRTLYFAPRIARKIPRHCFVINVPPLLRELILHACRAGRYTTVRPAQRRLIEFIVDQLAGASSIPLELPMPADLRARNVAARVFEDPGGGVSTEQLCRECGGSKRTIERLFQQETGMTFGRWRQQLRLLHAIPGLAAGEKVAGAAADCGYSSTSAFIAAFRKSFGMTPARYVSAGSADRLAVEIGDSPAPGNQLSKS